MYKLDNPDLNNVRYLDPDNPPVSLFHGTSIYNLASIVEENKLNKGGHWGKPNEPHGPRTSMIRDKAFQFIQYSCPEYAVGGLLELSGESLVKQYDLVDYRDTFFTGELMNDEKEVAILTEEICNLSQHLIAIHCDLQDIEWALDEENMLFAMEVGGWPFGHGTESMELAGNCLHLLAESHLIKPLHSSSLVALDDLLNITEVDEEPFKAVL